MSKTNAREENGDVQDAFASLNVEFKCCSGRKVCKNVIVQGDVLRQVRLGES